ncbi:hypothetical protein QP164_14720 [Sphingomonas sp. LR59]|uniref:hypothetical protein n=1 Tax=Sphingomonas sp. LR59 TaxID=3050232 RepID=UPI002FE058FC
MNRYSIQIGGIGGEMVIGELDPLIANTWSHLDHFELGDFLISKNGDMNVDANGDQIANNSVARKWSDFDSLMHVLGPVFDDGMKIDVDPEESPTLFSRKVTHRSLRSSIIDVETVGINPSASYLMARKGLLIHQIYGLEIAGEFDVSRLAMRFKSWGELRVLDGVSYNGVNVPLVHCCHRPMDDDMPIAVIVPGSR